MVAASEGNGGEVSLIGDPWSWRCVRPLHWWVAAARTGQGLRPSLSSWGRAMLAGCSGAPAAPQEGFAAMQCCAAERSFTALPFFFLMCSLNTFLISSHYLLPK